MIPSLRRVVHSVDPMTAVPDVRTLDAELKSALSARRLRMWLVGVYALLTLFIVLLGLVAVVTRAANERRKEFAIRSVLGASPQSNVMLIVRKYAASVSLGLAIGLAAAGLSSKWLQQFLYGVSPHDVATYSIGAVLVTAVAGLGTYLPARRAARIAPLRELRNS
jgi:ABC-type antimicrobial peptide transport system permease subunit